MGNVMPLLLDEHLRRTRGRSPLEDYWGADEVLRSQVEMLRAAGPSVSLDEIQVDLTPQPLLEIVEDLGGETWAGVAWVSPEDAERVFDLSTVAFEETAGLPDGFMFWPVDDAGLVMLPSDRDPGRAGLDLLTLEGWDEGSVRVGAGPLLAARDQVRQCHLHIHRQRPNVPHIGMCVEDEDEPCDRGCYEVVKGI